MKSCEELSGLMMELLEKVERNETWCFTSRAQEIVNEIADYAENTSIYQENKDMAESFFQNDDKSDLIFTYMLNRIVNAPTTVYRDSSVLLLMPALRKAVNEEYRR